MVTKDELDAAIAELRKELKPTVGEWREEPLTNLWELTLATSRFKGFCNYGLGSFLGLLVFVCQIAAVWMLLVSTSLHLDPLVWETEHPAGPEVKPEPDPKFSYNGLAVIMLVSLAILFSKDVLEVWTMLRWSQNQTNKEVHKESDLGREDSFLDSFLVCLYGPLSLLYCCVTTFPMMCAAGASMASGEDVGAVIGNGLSFYIVAQLDDWFKDLLNVLPFTIEKSYSFDDMRSESVSTTRNRLELCIHIVFVVGMHIFIGIWAWARQALGGQDPLFSHWSRE